MTELLSVEQAWESLKIHLEWANRFWLLYVFTDDPRVVDILRSRTQAHLLAVGRQLEDLRPKSTTRTDVLEVVEVLLEGRDDDGVAWVDFVRHDAPGSTAWHDAWQYACMQLNQRRELLRRQWSKGGIVLATTLDRLDETPGMAPDLWTIRSLLLRVATLPAEREEAMVEQFDQLDPEQQPRRDIELARQAVERARRELAVRPSDVRLRNLARTLDALADSLSTLGQTELALTTTQEMVEILRKLALSNPGTDLPTLATSLARLSHALSRSGRSEKALAAAQEAVDICRQLSRTDPVLYCDNLALSLINLGLIASSLGHSEEALTAAQEAVDLQRKRAVEDPPMDLHRLTMSLRILADSLSRLGQLEDALMARRELVSIQRKRGGGITLAAALNDLGVTLDRLGRREEALAAVREATDIWREMADAHPDTGASGLARSLHNLGLVLMSLGRQEEAVSATEEAARIRGLRLD